MRLILAGAAVTALFACGFPAADGKEAAAQAFIAALEKKVPLPDASRPLTGYDRYYAVLEDKVAAVYLPSRGGSGRIRVVGRNELPQAKGDACAAVNLVFDRKSDRFARVMCNEARLAHVAPAPTLPAPLSSGGERG